MVKQEYTITIHPHAQDPRVELPKVKLFSVLATEPRAALNAARQLVGTAASCTWSDAQQESTEFNSWSVHSMSSCLLDSRAGNEPLVSIVVSWQGGHAGHPLPDELREWLKSWRVVRA